jgi:putative salt-induced outer membrane protein YdiY
VGMGAPRDERRNGVVKTNWIRCGAAALLGLLLAAGGATADVVVLSDGSKLVGTVTEWMDGKLVLETQFAGTLEIDAAQVQRIETAEKVNVGMDTGDRLVGRIEWNESVNEPVVETELGGIPIAVERVEAIWPEGGKSPELRELERQAEETEAEMRKQIGKWAFALEIGARLEEGNSDTLEGRIRLELKRTSKKDMLKFYASGDYAEENDARSEAEAKGGAYYEYLFTERFFAYGRGELEYDEFEELELRASLSFGPGYYFIKETWHELKSFVGAGYQHESFFDGTTDNTALVNVGLDYRIDIKEWLRFYHSALYSPTFDGIDDYRLNFDTGLHIPLGKSEVWAIRLGVMHEYDAQPQPGVERLDTTYYANLRADFE